MDASKRLLIAEALETIVEKALHGGPTLRIGLMAAGSELGQTELLRGARQAQEDNPGLKVVAVGPRPDKTDEANGTGTADSYDDLEWIETPDCEADVAQALEMALAEGRIAGAVAMHFPFPIGVATIGRILTPGRGRPMFIASCTGSAASGRGEALLRNAIYGIATARSCGIANPSVAFLNIDGAGPALRALTQMQDRGYPVSFAVSERGDGGSLLRGNDIVAGGADVLVCDTLTGNVLIKVFSTYTTGGLYESQGWGYGPSAGEGWKQIVSIISRASGAPVVAGTLALTAKAAAGNLPALVAAELAAARQAGFDAAVEALKPKAAVAEVEIKKPAAVPVDGQIAGVDVMEMDNAAKALWKEGIYAETAMGCTGPVIRVATAQIEKAEAILKQAGFI